MVVQFRRKNDALDHHDMIIPIDDCTKSSGMTYPSRSSRLVCLVTTFAAFLMGVGVGITLPFALARDSTNFLEPSAPSTPKDIIPVIPQFKNNNYSNDQFNPQVPMQLWATPIPLNSLEYHSAIDNNIVEEESDTFNILDRNIFFSSEVEKKLPIGFSNEEVEEWRKFARGETVVKLVEGCGRMQNRLITFANGSQSCCRYRQNFDQIQGEIFSFYLSRLLGINHVPPSTLGVVKSGSKQWSNVGNQLALAQWNEERPVVLTKFIPDLDSSYIPSSLRSPTRRSLHPVDILSHDFKDNRGIAEIVQWSDLIIFDYLTANLDRVVNNLYNMQWNPSMMEAPAHNLAQNKATGLLVFLDNESGLLHGYRLLDKYESFHASLLDALCVFKKETAKQIHHLASKGDVGVKMKNMFRKYEPELTDFLPTIPEKSIKILNERLKNVERQIKKCQDMYS